MNKQELIKKYEETIYAIVATDEVLKDLKQLDEPIKLKDVIKRIKVFGLDTQKVWLNEILNELGSDYGSAKYKDGYEQGKLEGEWVGQQLKDADKIRQELNKPVVPQFVADWYEEHKDDLEFHIWDYILDWYEQEESEFKVWMNYSRNKPIKTLINMKQFGYKVEKKKRYLVKESCLV